MLVTTAPGLLEKDHLIDARRCERLNVVADVLGCAFAKDDLVRAGSVGSIGEIKL